MDLVFPCLEEGGTAAVCFLGENTLMRDQLNKIC